MILDTENQACELWSLYQSSILLPVAICLGTTSDRQWYIHKTFVQVDEVREDRVGPGRDDLRTSFCGSGQRPGATSKASGVLGATWASLSLWSICISGTDVTSVSEIAQQRISAQGFQ